VELPFAQLHFALLSPSVGAPRAGVTRGAKTGRPQRRAGLIETIEKVEFYHAKRWGLIIPLPA